MVVHDSDVDFTDTLVFYVNGKRVEDKNIDPEWTLLYYLRNRLRLCGTKLGCGEGGCGACTVMVSRYDRNTDKVLHIPVNACLAPVCSVHGQAVTTVEGIGSTRTRLHPVQERIAKAHGSQCGFCTPGIVMSMYTLLRNSPKPSFNDLEVAFQGNLCRCTGYRPILEGYKTFTEEWELIQNGNKIAQSNGGCGMGDKCCKIQKINGCVNGDKNNCSKLQNGTTNSKDVSEEEKLFNANEFTPYHPSQEPIFPPELKLTDRYDTQYVVIEGKNITWYRPISLKQLLELKARFPEAKIVVGNTEVGVEMKFRRITYPVIIQPVKIPEMNGIVVKSSGIVIGASVTLIEIEAFLREQIHMQKEYKVRIFQAIVEMMNWFAGKQIRSVGALGSNIMTGSPISDMIPVLMAARAELEFCSTSGSRRVVLDNNFFVGYRKNILKSDEILTTIHVPFTKEDQYFYAYKQARRREDDIAIVNAAVNVKFKPRSNIVLEIYLAFGGMSFKTVSAPKTEQALKGLAWNRETLELAYSHLLEDLPLDFGAPGGMIQFRRSLTLSLFFRAFLAITEKLATYIPGIHLDKRELSAIHGYHGQELKSSQYFKVVPDTQEKIDALQRPLVHASAFKQATGEAVYCDDIPFQEGELYCAFVLSTKPYAKVLSIDESDAIKMEGVHGFISAKDISTGHNSWGTIFYDEKVFYSDEVTAQGQIIGLIVSDDQSVAQRAAKKVKVCYEVLEPVILSIDDAIRHNSYFQTKKNGIRKGDIDSVLNTCVHVLEGECHIGGQEQFYLESQGCLVIPKPEDDEMLIYSSTQNPSEATKLVSEVLGIQQNKVTTKVKRIGGGFGGKETKGNLIILPLAVAAKKFNRPMRCILDRDEDIIMSGGRHPFYFKYKVGFDDDGKILGAKVELYSNCGYSYDLSTSVLERAMTHYENAYHIPVCQVDGYACKTNLTSNTAFRGFGAPQGMYLAECMVEHIAEYLRKDVAEVSQLNLYKEGDRTHYNQEIINCQLDKCWDECLSSSDYYRRREEATNFNRANRYKKRGLSIIPTKYGIAFTAAFLNQGGALVLIYTDGSVLISHGGVEMGQGLHTKMIQVASRSLGVSADKIHISETATDKVPNTSPTAASTGSDLNGMAVMDACIILKERLRPYRESNPKGTWEDWVKSAYLDRVSLSATGFHKTPGIGYDWETGQGNMFNYFTYGVACTEVEIDTLTGDHQVLRSDIVMDLGESLNPAIDIGQIEGAFVQGYGLFVLEELVYSPNGDTITRGPGTYKIPGFMDIPGEFNVSLLKGVSNPRAVYSSKAVGEPPLFLASSAMFAIKDAIKAAREENGSSRYFRLDAPATAAKIRMACQDHITSKLKDPVPGSFKPWNVVV